MNEHEAAEIVEIHKVTFGEIKALLRKVYAEGAADEKPNKLNPRMSNAAVYNILWCAVKERDDDVTVEDFVDIIVAKNALRAFGEFWTGWRPERDVGEVYHEPPIPPVE